MLLDAPTFELVLTPEAALAMVQKEVQKRGWKKTEIEEIRLVYTPYWVFSFDVLAEGSQPSGRAAINAHTGEIDETLPMLLERPLDKTKKTDEKSGGAEVESTSISREEVDRVAPAKIASQIGVKKDAISVSAISKYYVPAYRIWAVVPPETGDTYKIVVDALLGIPTGLEALPAKTRGWNDDKAITLEKLKSPQGWTSLIGMTIGSILGGGANGRKALLALLAIAAVILFFTAFSRSTITVKCMASQELLGEKPMFGFGEQPLLPKTNRAGQLYVNGVCQLKNTGKDATTVCVKVFLKTDGKDTALFNSTCVANLQPGDTPAEKEFTISWTSPTPSKYTLGFERFV